MIDVFGVILNSVIGYGTNWLMGQILPVRTICPRCQQRDQTTLGNQQTNYLECSNCHNQLEQFTNACDFTINRSTGQIGHGIFGVPGGQKWRWENHGNFFQPRERLVIPFNIRIAGLQGRSVLLVTEIRRFHDEEFVAGHESMLEPAYDSTSWTDYWHAFSPSRFSSEDKKSHLICDAQLVSEFHDILFEDRRIIKPWK
jgi:hypothetical protein